MKEDNEKFHRRQMDFEQIASIFESEIHTLLQKQGRFLKATKGCFADDSALVAALIEGSLDKAAAEQCSQHLLACDQCFHSVTNFAHSLSQDTGCETNPVAVSSHARIPSELEFADRVWLDWFGSLGLYPNGPTMFPDGTVADGAW